MVVDVQPVADIEPIAVERHLQPINEIRDEERDHLLRELIRAVVVGAPRARHAHAIGAVVRADQQLGGCLRRGVRGVGQQWRLLGPRPRVDGAVDLVGADVHHARRTVPPAGIQKRLRAHDVGDHEVLRSRDRPVHVRLGREVDHHVMARHHLIQDRTFADVALDERVAGVLRNSGEIREIAGIGELVEHGHACSLGTQAAIEQATHVVRADEAGSAGDEISHARILGTRVRRQARTSKAVRRAPGPQQPPTAPRARPGARRSR